MNATQSASVDRRNELLRAVLGGGVGTALALAIAGWPDGVTQAIVGVAGLVVGTTLAFGVEFLLDRYANVRALQTRIDELEDDIARRAEVQRLMEHQLVVARRTATIGEVDIKIWGDAFHEAASTGRILPLAAIMARREMEMKARNLDRPIPPRAT